MGRLSETLMSRRDRVVEAVPSDPKPLLLSLAGSLLHHPSSARPRLLRTARQKQDAEHLLAVAHQSPRHTRREAAHCSPQGVAPGLVILQRLLSSVSAARLVAEANSRLLVLSWRPE